MQSKSMKSPALSVRRPRIAMATLTLAIVMDTIVQLCWKVAVDAVPNTLSLWSSVGAVFSEPLFHVAVVVFVLQFFNWMIVLSHMDLSYAQPITSLSYLTVTACSIGLFQEPLHPRRVVALALILMGVWLISRTQFQTLPSVST